MVRAGTITAAFILLTIIPASGAIPVHFEPSGEKFTAVTSRLSAQIDSRGFLLQLHGASPIAIHWSGATAGRVSAEQPTGGHSNYYVGSDPATWRTDVPHYGRVVDTGVYRGIDIVFRPSDDAIEFDFQVAAGADPRGITLDIDAPSRLSAAGDLLIGKTARLRFHKPEAWQIVDGVRRAVECSFRAETVAPSRSRIGLRLGAYDHLRALVIDPAVEYLTYLGGNGSDQIQADALDPQGNAILGGVSTSTNFPGTSGMSPGDFILVTKLSSDGSRVLYTTVLGSGAPLSNNLVLDRLTSVTTDSAGNAFITGITYDIGNFPVTPGAWQTAPPAALPAFLTQLDAAGHAAYSTYIGNSGWTPSPGIVRARNGIVYLAGTISSLSFLGTAGAVQRDLLGRTNFFAMAIRPDGSAPLFITALGGSGIESLFGMDLDAAGDMLLAGTSTSTDFPLAPGELGYRNPAGQTSAVIARLSSDGTALLDSSYLGTPSVSALAMSPDRMKVIILGNSTLPADLIAKAPHHAINFSPSDRLGYAAEFSAAPLTPVWTTTLSLNGFSTLLQTDSQGNIYFTDNSAWASGGSLSFASQNTVVDKLAPDGSRIELAAAVPVAPLVAGNGGGDVLLAGSGFGGGLTTTPGVAEPTYPAKLPPPSFNQPTYTGVVLKYDSSSFTGDNFFVEALSTGIPSITYRIGEPAPITPVALPVVLNTTPFPLSITASNPALQSTVSADSKAIDISVNPPNAGTAATTTEHVTLISTANPAASLSIPVSLTIKPAVSFSLTTNQVSISLRSGQTYTPTTVGVTENFGSDYLTLNTSSDSTWLRATIFSDALHHDQLSVFVSPLDPGTYQGTITVSINGLQQGKQTIQVTYVVTPAVPIQLSATTFTMHVVKGQPVQPVSVNVTSAVPGIPFSVFVGVSRTWLSYTVIGKSTPGSIQFTADSNAATPGYYDFAFFVMGEGNQQTQGTLFVDVSSGAPLDATPSSITYTYFRSGTSGYLPPEVDITSAAISASVSVSTDKPWLTTSVSGRGSGSAPLFLYLYFDTTMPEGVYQGNVTVSSTGGASLKIPVTLNLYDEPHLVFSANSFTFNYQIGDSPPPAQMLTITSPTLEPGSFEAGPGSLPTFLHVTPEFGSTPATLTITADPTGRSPGTYKDVIYTQAVGNTAPGVVRIPVTLNITADPNAPPSSISAITDAASYLAGTVAPGEIVVLFGSQLGPATLSQVTPDPVHGFPATWNGTTVYFDSTPAPVIYTSSGQTSVVAPFEIAGEAKTSVTVSTNGKTSTAFTLAVAATNPSIFSADASGTGQAAAFRITPSGVTALNNSGNPATAGDIISFYATGLGLTSPVQVDGSVTGTPPALQSAVKVLMGGQTADILYSGPAPDLVAGAYQINARVPAGLPSGPVQLLVISGDNPSPPGVTVAIQ